MHTLPHKSSSGFTLVEIMIVVAIIALLAAIAVPNFLRARKRSQATMLLNNLRLIDGAKDQYAIETNKTSATPVAWDLAQYFKDNSLLNAAFWAAQPGDTTVADPKIQHVTYYINTGDVMPSIDTASAYSDVVDSSFWSPYVAN